MIDRDGWAQLKCILCSHIFEISELSFLRYSKSQYNLS